MKNIWTVKNIVMYKGMRKHGYNADVYLGERYIELASKFPDDGLFLFMVSDEEKEDLFSIMPEEILSKALPIECFITKLVDEAISSAMMVSGEVSRADWEAKNAYHD